ncbi:MAG: sulfotransferase [Pseudomonadota bacterium]
MQNQKILGLGFMKTGLTSLFDILEQHGFACHGRSRRAVFDLARGRVDAVMRLYDEGDAFIDWPHPYMFRPFHRRFGADARFILTLRDEAKWYQSLLRHNAMAHPVTHTNYLMFGRFYPHGFEEEHRAIYRAHIAAVRAFIAEEGLEAQYLELDVAAPDAYPKLCAFLGLEPLAEGFPWSNRSADHRPRNAFYRFRLRYNRAVQPLYGRHVPRLRPRPGPILKPAL